MVSRNAGARRAYAWAHALAVLGALTVIFVITSATAAGRWVTAHTGLVVVAATLMLIALTAVALPTVIMSRGQPTNMTISAHNGNAVRRRLPEATIADVLNTAPTATTMRDDNVVRTYGVQLDAVGGCRQVGDRIAPSEEAYVRTTVHTDGNQ